jgi:hypothetical protein
MRSFGKKITPPDTLVTDPYWDKVVLYQRFDGGVNTDLTGNYTITTSGTVTTQTANPKIGTHTFGKSSGGFLIYTPVSGAKMSFGTGDFTVEYWFYMAGTYPTNNNYGMFGMENRINGTPGGAWGLLQGATGGSTYIVQWYNGGGTGGGQMTGITTNAWHHFAFSRTNGTLYSFVDGSLKFSTSYTRTITELNPRLGTDYYSESGYAGLYDEIRVTSGIGRYTQDFPIQTKGYPTPTLT